MATDVSICSSALILLGEAPIASLTEGSKRAIQAASLWPAAKRDILRLHPWNCAIRRVTLAPLVDAPDFGFRSAFAKPGDWLRLLQVGEDGETDYQLEGGLILADVDVLRLVYVAEIDVDLWDALMVDLAIKRMAADLAYPVTKSSTLADSKLQQYLLAAKAAKRVDGQENPPESWAGGSPFLEVRQ